MLRIWVVPVEVPVLVRVRESQLTGYLQLLWALLGTPLRLLVLPSCMIYALKYFESLLCKVGNKVNNNDSNCVYYKMNDKA